VGCQIGYPGSGLQTSRKYATIAGVVVELLQKQPLSRCDPPGRNFAAVNEASSSCLACGTRPAFPLWHKTRSHEGGIRVAIEGRSQLPRSAQRMDWLGIRSSIGTHVGRTGKPPALLVTLGFWGWGSLIHFSRRPWYFSKLLAAAGKKGRYCQKLRLE